MKRARPIRSIIEQMYDRKKYQNNKPLDENMIQKMTRRVELGHCIVPTDKSQEEVCKIIISTELHESMKNFPYVLNNEELMLEFATLAPNPVECTDYFYGMINEHILAKEEFRIAFLRRIYLNDKVYLIEDVDKFIETFHLEKENDKLLFDKELLKELKVRLSNVHTYPTFEASGCKNDKQYSRLKDELTELNKKKDNGLRVIIARFENVQENLIKEENEEVEI